MRDVGQKVAELWAEAFALVVREVWIAGGAILLLWSASSAGDTFGGMGILVGAVVQLGLHWILLRYVARRERWISADDPVGGVLRLVGVGILYTGGVVLACFLFLLPGLYLAGRWSAAGVILVAEHRGEVEALGVSWARTREWGVAIAILLCGAYLPLIGLTILSDPGATETQGELLVMNAAVAVSLVAGWYLGLAVYARTRVPHEGLEQVFA
jgi:hypothetical protein